MPFYFFVANKINQNLYYYQNNSCAPEGVIGAHYMRFNPPFCRRLEGKEFCAFQRGTPSLAGRPLFQNSPPDCFEIHPLRSARCRGISLSAESDEGAALDPQALFRRKPFLGKGLTPNLFNMHDLAHYPCIAVGESSSGKYCFPFSLLSSQSFLLFGDLFPK